MKRILAAVILTSILAAPALAQDDDIPRRTKPWDKETLKLASTLAIQDQGRVKPLSTYAGFLLLRIRGVRKAYTPEPDKKPLSPTAWMLDCLFFPEQAEEYEIFLIQNSEVLTSIGLAEVAKRKRDRYSFAELEQGVRRLFEKAEGIRTSGKESKEWTPVEAQTMGLARNIQEFMGLTRSLDFARHPLRVNMSPGLGIVYANAETLPVSEVIRGGPKVTFLFRQMQSRPELPRERVDREVRAIQKLARSVETITLHSRALAIFPPSETPEEVGAAIALPYHFMRWADSQLPAADKTPAGYTKLYNDMVAKHLDDEAGNAKLAADLAGFNDYLEDQDSPVTDLTARGFRTWLDVRRFTQKLHDDPRPDFLPTEVKEAVDQSKVWMSPSHLASDSFTSQRRLSRQHDMLGVLEQLEANKSDPAAFKKTLQELHGGLKDIADERREYHKVPWEVVYYHCDFFYWALLLYLLAFLFVATSWMVDKKWLIKAVWGLVVFATALTVIGITYRCILRGRPPVTTLYETILFITATGVIAALAIESINRQRIALALSTVLGAGGMYLSYKYELRPSGGDTMGTLIAVLDTNFWLSTHVTTVTLGYSAGLLAAALAHIYLVGKTLGLKANDKAFYKTIARMTYGVICFGLLFSVVGTILGGIWANYSWGRFWGWDPKENGALLIILWELIILHARLGGYIKDWGLCAMSILGGMVVVFSWWGVNLLGVGLHSYGFTEGVAAVIVTFYVIETLLVIVAAGAYLGAKGAQVGKEVEEAVEEGEAPVLEDDPATDFEPLSEEEAQAAVEAQAEAEPAPEAEADAPEAEGPDDAPEAEAETP